MRPLYNRPPALAVLTPQYMMLAGEHDDAACATHHTHTPATACAPQRLQATEMQQHGDGQYGAANAATGAGENALENAQTPLDMLTMPESTPARPTHQRSATAKKARRLKQKIKKKAKIDNNQTADGLKDVLKDTKLGRMLQHSFMRGRAAEKAVSKDRRAQKRIMKQTIHKQAKAGKRLAKRRRAAAAK